MGGCQVPVGTRRGAKDLDALLPTLDTTALVVMQKGRTVYRYGDERLISYVASARKSRVSMLYGPSVARQQIDPDVTLGSLGFDEVPAAVMEWKSVSSRG
jgi:hypothetical protein